MKFGKIVLVVAFFLPLTAWADYEGGANARRLAGLNAPGTLNAAANSLAALNNPSKKCPLAEGIHMDAKVEQTGGSQQSVPSSASGIASIDTTAKTIN